MNTLEACYLINPIGKTDECAKFTIDDVTNPFLMPDITENTKQYTFSCWLKSDADGHIIVSGSTLQSTTEWSRHVVTYTATGADLVFTFGVAGTYYIYNSKLEAGNKATGWMPAPEDMVTSKEVDKVQTSADAAQSTADAAAERAIAAESAIEKLAESISMLVTDGSGTSLMTQTSDGWTFSTAELQSAVNAVSESLSGLTNEVGDVNGIVSVLQQAVADLGTLAEYIKIGTYEDEPCIELGEGDSDFKLIITNTRIMFMEGANVPAYINNQSLHIKKAVVEEELLQGGFVWKARSNGNMGLIWKGVSS